MIRRKGRNVRGLFKHGQNFQPGEALFLKKKNGLYGQIWETTRDNFLTQKESMKKKQSLWRLDREQMKYYPTWKIIPVSFSG